MYDFVPTAMCADTDQKTKSHYQLKIECEMTVEDHRVPSDPIDTSNTQAILLLLHLQTYYNKKLHKVNIVANEPGFQLQMESRY